MFRLFLSIDVVNLLVCKCVVVLFSDRIKLRLYDSREFKVCIYEFSLSKGTHISVKMPAKVAYVVVVG